MEYHDEEGSYLHSESTFYNFESGTEALTTPQSRSMSNFVIESNKKSQATMMSFSMKGNTIYIFRTTNYLDSLLMHDIMDFWFRQNDSNFED